MDFTFRMKRGSSYKSDVAIDDVLLRQGECQKIPEGKTSNLFLDNYMISAPSVPMAPKEQKKLNDRLATWKPLGTTEKYSWTTAPPLKPYATSRDYANI